MNSIINEMKDKIKDLRCEGMFSYSLLETNCTRFASSVITQNTTNIEQGLSVELAEKIDGRYRLSSGSSGDSDLDKLLNKALDELEDSPFNDEFKGFVSPSPSRNIKTSCESTKNISLIEKAGIIREIINAGDGLITGGILITSVMKTFIISTSGLELEEEFTSFNADVKFENEEGKSSSIQSTGRDIDKFDYKKLAKEAVEKCRNNKENQKLPDGEYNILFSPSTVSEFMYFLSLLSFGGREFKQKRSFACGKMNEKIIENDRITIRDNPFNPLTLTENYDSEGTPRQELLLVEKGICRNIAHNTLTADTIEGTTGHAMGNMAYAMLMEMDAGEGVIEEMKNLDNTIHISRFHYPTIDDQNRIILKGSTKDGTFFLRDGKKIALENLEFVFEIPVLLSKINELSNKREVLPQGSLASSLPGANIAPWAVVKNIESVSGKLICLKN